MRHDIHLAIHILNRVGDFLIGVIQRPFHEGIHIDRLAEINGNGLLGICNDRRLINQPIVIEIRSFITLGVELSGADVVRVGSAEERDQLVFISALLVVHGDVVVVERVVLLAELAVHRAGLVERGLGVEVGAQGPLIDLIKVG